MQVKGLYYAYYIILIADNKNDLLKMLNVTDTFSRKWGLKINEKQILGDDNVDRRVDRWMDRQLPFQHSPRGLVGSNEKQISGDDNWPKIFCRNQVTAWE